LASALLVCGAFPSGPRASNLIDRDASDVTLAVNAGAQALLTYRAHGRLRHVLAWGAIGARDPRRGRRQNAFRLDYRGGRHRVGRSNSRAFGNVCGPYRGPELAWLVAACTAPDGSHWAVQSWQRALPPYGAVPTELQAAWELRLSHWRGDTALPSVRLDWTYRRYHHLFGRFTYRGRPVFGFRSTPRGVPLDAFGRNVFIDTFNSAYGPGWKRENGLLTHVRTGVFCYAFYARGARPSGMGDRYRITISGPGVTPDVMWESGAPGQYAREADVAANKRLSALADPVCKPN
jgi:hypothetical protein